MSSRRSPDAAAAMLGEMTREELVGLVSGRGMWENSGVPRLGVAPLTMSDGPNGVRGFNMISRDGPAFVGPCETALASTFDLALIERVGTAIGGEARRMSIDIVLGPTLNMHRLPNTGRHFEVRATAGFRRGVAVAWESVGACACVCALAIIQMCAQDRALFPPS